MKNQYVYHLIEKGFKGTILFSLNDLKEELPAIYQKQLTKYKGREFLLKRRIVKINCNWNDVVHLSPYHPHVIYKALLQQGITPEEMQWVKIPVDYLDDRLTVIYRDYTQNENWMIEVNDIDALDKISSHLPKETIDYYKAMHKAKKDPMLFMHAHHVLYHSPIDIDGLEIISWSKEAVMEVEREERHQKRQKKKVETKKVAKRKS